MKIFTNRSITKKVLIVILTVMLLTFSVPKPVSADAGGILMSPLVSLITGIADIGQYLLEWTILGRPNYFMDQTLSNAETSSTPPDKATITVDKKIDGSFFGLDEANVPDIQYTPEAIFANKVPGLDVNFIKPSVTTGDEETDNQYNIALKLRPVISSWYVAMRTLALVGLLSVLVYLGIRMLLTGIAADKAKYKKMIMDWLIAMCLLFALHYIMSFALTMSEVVTSMIVTSDNNMVSVYVEQEGKVFDMTLMNYVRFMVQCTDFTEKVSFCLLYFMLMIFSIKFTWVYLKRVVNMAFLTLIAPIITVTYPIDKVSDGKAQAFGLWIKEFAFNALLQPLHLFLYTILLGAATELAIQNPLYAIVCLGFITAAEKLFKKMFGFDKASAGTIGSLATAAGLTGVANKAIMSMRKQKGGPSGKVRTNERQGKDPGANKGYNSFDKESNQGLAQIDDGGNTRSPNGNEGEVPSPDGNNGGGVPSPNGNNGGGVLPPDEDIPFAGQEEMDILGKEIDELEESGAVWNDPELAEQMRQKQERYAELEAQRKAQQNSAPQGNENVQQAMRNLGPEQPETWAQTMNRIQDELDQENAESNRRPTWNSLKEQERKAKEEAKERKLEEKSRKRRDPNRLSFGTKEDRRKSINELKRRAGVGAYNTIKGIKTAAPELGKKFVRSVGKGVVQGAGAAFVGAVGVAAGAALTGDAEQSIGMGIAAATGGGTLTGRVFEGTVGKKIPKNEHTTREILGTAKYGSATDYKNAKADAEHLRSQEHRDEYEKYFKDGKYAMSKEEFDKATREYRQVGITDTKQIRKALHLEAQYAKNGGDRKEIRGKVQNIAQSYDAIDRKAVYNSDAKATEATLKNIESQIASGDAKQKRAIANEILQGYRDWYNTP